MVDVVLVQPPVRDFYLTAKRTIPYGLTCIAAALSATGVSVAIVDALATRRVRNLALPGTLEYLEPFYGKPDAGPFGLFHRFRHYGASYGKIAATVQAHKPLLVGISALFSAYSREARRTAAAIKAACPDCVLVAGGHHPTVFPAETLAWPSVDVVLRGEGEASLPYLVRVLKQGGDLSRVPGIVFRKPDQGLHVSPSAHLADLDAAPLPAVELLNHRYYQRKEGGSVVVTASRGCPMTCTYCCLGRDSQVPYRRRRTAAVMAEIRRAVCRHGVRFVDFEDENLSLNRRWFVDLLSRLIGEFKPGLLELRAMNGLYPATLDDDLVSLMAAAGFRTLNLSLGSADPGQARRFGRSDMRGALDGALRSAQTNGLDAVAYLITAAPGQHAADSVDDLLFLARRRVLAAVSTYYPAPGSVDWDLCHRLGVLPDDSSRWRSSALPVDHTTSRVQAATLLRLSRILNFMKGILDAGRPLPEALPLASDRLPRRSDRHQIGRILLGAFLHDHRIRGVMPDGQVYCHATDLDLSRKFIEGLAQIPLAGASRAESSKLKAQRHYETH